MSINIALDGPSGVGKTTIAKAVAAELGYTYIDTGAMYRALAVYFTDLGLDPASEFEIESVLDLIDISLEYSDGVQHVLVNGKDVTDRLRTEEISRTASITSQYPAVREKLLGIQRDLARKQNVVMDGRDIGTVILPDAQLKVFMTAKPEVQAMRRYRQLEAQGKLDGATYETILEDIRERDLRDRTRETAPLVPAEDAVQIDTSELTIAQVKARILEELHKRIG